MAASTTNDAALEYILIHYKRLNLERRWKEPARWARLSKVSGMSTPTLCALAGIPQYIYRRWRKDGTIQVSRAQAILLTVIEHQLMQGTGSDTIEHVFPHTQ